VTKNPGIRPIRIEAMNKFKMPKIDFTSFRTKIILTLVIVTALFSFASFQIYSKYLSKRIYESAENNIKSILHMLEGEIINVHDGRLIKPMLRNIQQDKRIIGTYLLDSNGRFLLPEPEGRVVADSMDFEEFIASKQDISVKTYRSASNPYSRAFLHVMNQPACYECHAPAERTLGYVALDFSMEETRSTLAFTRNFSILFTAFMVLIIMVFVLIMHYRFIKKSLSQFQQVIRSINQGDIDARVNIPESRELSRLGIQFNDMLDTFQHAQKELSLYHEKELKDAEKMAAVGEMAARLAHEVRNPLTGIANSIEIIAREIEDNSTKLILEEIKRQANRVNVAISNLLKFSRSTEVHPRTGNVNEMIASLVVFLKSQSQNKQVEIDFFPDLDTPRFEFDTEQLENVLLNLSLNAIQAMRGAGSIVFRTKFDRSANSLLISVEDTGPGILQEIAGEIFRPFFTTRTEGTGLGLAISKDIIENHNGKIWFESSISNGTVFYVTLPVKRKEDSD
jgi:two-component system, NtrC family, sensor kinase